MTDLQPILDPTHLAVARFAPGRSLDEPVAGFCVVIDDGVETTVVAPEAVVEAMDGSVEVDPGWRRITFPGPLPWEQVGFIADVAGRLATAGIPLAAMAGFTTDHLLVRAAHADLAVSVLQGHEPPPPRPGVAR